MEHYNETLIKMSKQVEMLYDAQLKRGGFVTAILMVGTFFGAVIGFIISVLKG